MGSGLPSWPNLLRALYSRACADAVEPDKESELTQADDWFSNDKAELLEKASFLAQTMGPDWLRNAIAREFRTAKPNPTSIHEALAQIPGAAFITTNYDVLLEQALASRTGASPRVVLLSDVEGIRDFSTGQVLKLHGDFDAPETIALSSEDYFRVSYRAEQAWKERLKALLQPPFQVLLVGYSYGDIDAQQAVNELRGAYRDRAQGPFWLVRSDVRAKTRASAEHLRFIGLRDHVHMVPWLQDLANKINGTKAQAPAVIKAMAYEKKLLPRLNDEQTRAGELYSDEQFEEAERLYRKLLQETEDLLAKDPESKQMRRHAAKSRTNIGFYLLSEHRVEEGRALLLQVADNDLSYLSSHGRILVAEALAQLGELEHARGILESELEPSAEAQSLLAEANTRIEVLEGNDPTDAPITSPLVGMWSARALLERRQFRKAAQVALETIELSSKDGLARLYCSNVLQQALSQSIYEAEGSRSLIPIGEREPVVATIEQTLDSLKHKSGSPRIVRECIELAVPFYELTDDVEHIEETRKLIEDLEASDNIFLPPEVIAFDRAQDLASEGKLDEAFAAIPNSNATHPWQQGREKAHLRVLARDFEGALRDVLDLANRFPKRAPIEYLAAQLLARASRRDEALQHARAAFEALPGRGCRLLLGFSNSEQNTTTKRASESEVSPTCSINAFAPIPKRSTIDSCCSLNLAFRRALEPSTMRA